MESSEPVPPRDTDLSKRPMFALKLRRGTPSAGWGDRRRFDDPREGKQHCAAAFLHASAAKSN
jgi:hypothetical protein